MRSLLAIAALLSGCGARRDSDAAADRRVEIAADRLTRTADPAAASAVVTELGRAGCAGLRDALAALGQSRMSGRMLAALADDAVGAAAEAGCDARQAATVLGRETGASFQLARARALAERPAEALAQLEPASREPAVHLRRAEILASLDRPGDAVAVLEAFLARVPDDGAARAARIEALIALGRAGDAVAAAAPATAVPDDEPSLREARPGGGARPARASRPCRTGAGGPGRRAGSRAGRGRAARARHGGLGSRRGRRPGGGRIRPRPDTRARRGRSSRRRPGPRPHRGRARPPGRHRRC